MSLTSDIAKQGKVYQWLSQEMQEDAVKRILANHNKLMASQRCLKPSVFDNYPFAEVGMAFTYAFRDQVTPLSETIEDTVAYRGAVQVGCDAELEQLLAHDHAGKYLIMAGLDRYRRTGKMSDILSLCLSDTGGKLLPHRLDREMWHVCEDLTQLIASVPGAWGHDLTPNRPDALHVNPTFTASYWVGGADAQMILNGSLIDVRTTVKRMPFTIENFFQQIGYVLLDIENEYNIESVAWYYSRQQVVFSYPVDRLFKNLADSRQRFWNYLTEDRLLTPGYDETEFDEGWDWEQEFWDDMNRYGSGVDELDPLFPAYSPEVNGSAGSFASLDRREKRTRAV